MLKRPRRNRKTQAVRSLLQENFLRPSDFVMPFFVMEGENQREALPTLPGVYRLSKDEIVQEAEKLHKAGVPAIILFPIYPADRKDPFGRAALDPNGIIPETVRYIKERIPSLCVLCDIALDPYTSHGHDGLIDENGYVLNDETVEILCDMALLYAQCGVDFVAPSDMMDGRVRAIRKVLDAQNHKNVGIISYTAKYASSLYGPFRDTLGSHLKIGDKKSYQMDPSNIKEALREATLDEEEGADALMVKPALFYLDVIAKMKEAFHIPICAYHVSGEYAMVMAAQEKGYMDAKKVFHEALLSIKRAGADFIISYAVPQIIDMLN
jgi:porphobilinogen synthase